MAAARHARNIVIVRRAGRERRLRARRRTRAASSSRPSVGDLRRRRRLPGCCADYREHAVHAVRAGRPPPRPAVRRGRVVACPATWRGCGCGNRARRARLVRARRARAYAAMEVYRHSAATPGLYAGLSRGCGRHAVQRSRAGPWSSAEQRRALPDQPGVYLFRDAKGKVIYVGKAKSVRKRVASHFSNPSTPARAARWSPRSSRSSASSSPPRPRRCWPSRASSSSTGRASTSACATTSPIRSSRSRSTRTSRGSTSRASATAATAPTSAPTRTPSGCARRSRCSPRCSCSAPARGRSRAGAAAAPASTTTSSAAGRPASATSPARSTARRSTA